MKMLNHKQIYSISFSLALIASQSVAANDLVVIVNSSNPIDSLTKDEITNIFLVKTDAFPNGDTAIPVDQPEKDEDRQNFYSKVVGKNTLQLNKYWAREMFSGRALPPDIVGDNSEISEWVSRHVDAIGYTDKSNVTKGVKVVYEIE